MDPVLAKVPSAGKSSTSPGSGDSSVSLLRFNKSALSWLLLGLGMAGSMALALNTKRTLEKEAIREFVFACDQIMLKVQERLAAYALVLQSGAALSANGPVSDDDWSEHTYSLRVVHGLETLQIFGFRPVNAQTPPNSHTEPLRMPLSVSVSGARIPAGLEAVQPAVLHEAMRQAGDTGRVALSGRTGLELGNPPGMHQGVFMYAPVYRKGLPRHTVPERRAALLGWTYSAYRVEDLMDSILHEYNRHDNREIAVFVSDGQQTPTDKLMFEHSPGTTQAERSLFFQERVVEFNGRAWVVGFDRMPGSPGVSYYSAWATLAAGLLLSGLLFALVQSLTRSRAKSLRMATRLTRELQQRENLLRASEENLRSTLDTLPYLLFELELSGRFLVCHGPAAELQAFDAPKLIGRSIQELMPAAAAQTVLSALREALVTGESHGQKIALKVGGERRWFELSVSRKPIAPGEPTRFIVLSRDVTAREHSKAELVDAIDTAERANRAKSRFLAAASHDLRQPLSALALYVGVLRSRAAQEQQAIVQSIDDCVGSLAELLTDLLDVSKLDAGVVKPQISSFALDELLETLVSVHGAKARVKGLTLRLRSQWLVVNTDRTLLHRMLGNLVSNAIRYTHSGGVLVACRRHADRHWVEVWDSGVGIEADKTGIIFEEFRQLDDGARNRGSGLGLAIVAKSAALLGLRIRVASRPGRGSMFAIELPPQDTEQTSLPLTRTLPRARSLRIAIVDDNAQVLESLTMALQASGHEVIAAQNGTDLMRQLGSLAPDVLLSDYRLTQAQTGLTVIAQARQAFGEDLPAMLMTGDTDPSLIRSMAELGLAVQFKPLQLDVLLPMLLQMTERGTP